MYDLQHHLVIHGRKDPTNKAEANPGLASAWATALQARPGIDKTQVLSPCCKESYFLQLVFEERLALTSLEYRNSCTYTKVLYIRSICDPS